MYKTVQYVSFINRASPVDPPIRVLPFGPGSLYNQRCCGNVVATYITVTPTVSTCHYQRVVC